MRLKNYEEGLKQVDKPPAFILGKYSVVGLGISRALGRLGIPVFWLSPNPKAVGFLSKYCKYKSMEQNWPDPLQKTAPLCIMWGKDYGYAYRFISIR